jgi:uncharacterized protein GlcG (DUF336 family)
MSNTTSLASLCLALLGTCTLVRTACADIPLDAAVDAARAAVSECRAKGYSVTVTILDADYSARVVLRDSSAAAPTVDIARRKAYTVLKMGVSSGDFGKTVPGTAPPVHPNPGDPPPPPPGPVNGDPNLITWAGGLPIQLNGKIVGAMSASGAPGGDKDEACVKAGLAKLAPRLK